MYQICSCKCRVGEKPGPTALVSETFEQIQKLRNFLKTYIYLCVLCSHRLKILMTTDVLTVLFICQIAKVPGHKFWASLTELKVVFLHDNSISKLDNVHYMAASPSISILTLYDTPLSLKPNYRHHLVNSLWSLKSLDNIVISDEEIIEDSSFGGSFAPLQPRFFIKPSCSLTKVR